MGLQIYPELLQASEGLSLNLGYSSLLRQIFIVTRGGSNNFLWKWNVGTHTWDLNHHATIADFGNSTKPSAFALDSDGQMYGGTPGGVVLTKYDNLASTLHTIGWPTFPESVYYIKLHTVGGTRYVYALSDTQVAGADATGTGLSFIGLAGFALPINSNGHFGIQIDSSNRVWAFGCNGSFTNLGDATLLMINPAGGVTGSAYNTTATYTVSGAVYGQPEAMFYSKQDNTLVFFTATGNLVKWDIATQAIIDTLDISANVNNERQMQSASRFDPDANGNVWLPGLDGHTIYLYNLYTLSLASTYDMLVFGGAGTGFSDSAFGFMPEAKFLVSGRDDPPFANWYADFSFLPAKNRMIFVMT